MLHSALVKPGFVVQHQNRIVSREAEMVADGAFKRDEGPKHRELPIWTIDATKPTGMQTYL